MITQNPIIGKARKKTAGIYSRTLYGKNVLQTCPPSRKGKQTRAEMAASASFTTIARLSNQVPASLLNFIYYSQPVGRSRRSQWMKDLASGRVKENGQWQYHPQTIAKLGGNPIVSDSPLNLTIQSTTVEIDLQSVSAINNAITSEKPCLILIDVDDIICTSLIDNTTLSNDKIILQHLSNTLIGKNCWIFPLWKVNVGTQQNPIYAFGRYEKS